MKTGIILVAGGSGTRMGTDIPKQFLLLQGKPLLMYTIDRFASVLPGAKIVVVLPENQIIHWASLCEQYAFATEHTVVSGGKARFHSVRNGLDEVADCDYIGVHDGVRPTVSCEVVLKTLEAAQDFGAAIPVVALSDSLREVQYCDECQDTSKVLNSRPVDRSRFVAVQTPQFFRTSILLKSYEQEYVPEFTDDASVVESAGYTVTLAPGDPANIKVTTPFDLAVVETIMKK